MLRTLITSCLLSISFVMSVSAQEEKTVADRTKKQWLTILEKDEKMRMRKGAVLALGIFGAEQPDVLPVLRKTLLNEKEDPQVRGQVISVYNTLSDKALQNEVPTLADVMKFDKSIDVRAGAIGLLGRLGKNAKPALTSLTETLSESDIRLKIAAAETLGKIGAEAKSAIPNLIPLLKHADKGVRYTAVYTLGRLGNDAVTTIPDLLPLLENDPDPEVRREVVRTVGLFGPQGKSALPTLVKSLREDKSEEVREQIALSLDKFEQEVRPFVGELMAVLPKDTNKTVRVYLVRTVSSTQGSELKNQVKGFLACLSVEKDSDVRVALIQELGTIGPDAKEAIPALEASLGDVQVAVREAAKDALKRIRTVPKASPKN